MARRATEGRTRHGTYANEQLLVAAAFATSVLKRQWFSGLFEGDVPREAGLLVLEVYLRYKRGQLLTMKQAGEAMGAEHPDTTRKYIKMASDAKLLDVTRAVGDERKRLLVPTKELLEALDGELARLADDVRQVNDALSARPPMMRVEIDRKPGKRNPFLADDNPLIQDLFNATDPPFQYRKLQVPGTELPFGHFLKRAIAEYTETIELAPDNASAYANRARAYDLLNTHGKAIADYSKAIELSPDLDRVYYLRAECYTAEGKHELAVEDWTEVIERNLGGSATISALLNRAAAFRALKQPAKAAADYRKVLEIRPDNKHALQGLRELESGVY